MNKRLRFRPLAIALALLSPSAALHAKVTPAPLFVEHAVLQQGREIPVWGLASPGEKVTVTVADQTQATTANAEGHWRVNLTALPAGGPYAVEIKGENAITLKDVLVGEVWICSGQSNMERQLGPRPPQKPILGWEEAVATANFPQIRHFGAAQSTAPKPKFSVKGEWAVCTPQTAADFSAVGFFFGRALHRAKQVPVGLIHSSWGGTIVEAWMSRQALEQFPGFGETLRQLDERAANPEAAARNYLQAVDAWYRSADSGTRMTPSWSSPDAPSEDWTEMKLPTTWETAGLEGLDGVVWFRKTIELPAGWGAAEAMLNLGPIDDVDTTWVNGVRVGGTELWNTSRHYTVPAGLLKSGKNVVAIRVLDTSGNGGIWGNGEHLTLTRGSAATETDQIALDGPWFYKIGVRFERGSSRPPVNISGSANVPTVLYNGMIAPLLPYAIRGVIWYQGEANAEHAREYRDLFPGMITDWRQKWGQGDFPFLYVQIAPFNGMNPEIREAQLLTLNRVPNVAMAVTTDVGDAGDIHPANKQPVGERLALAARVLAYGEKIVYSGPEFTRFDKDGAKIVIQFKHVGGGLVAQGGGSLTGFTVAGSDHVFQPAKAEIKGDTVVVTSDAVAQPLAARYGWSDVPQGNLFNKEGLPASPFRTDAE